MNIYFQSMKVPCDFTQDEINAICYSIERFGDGAHPQPTIETLSGFGFRYVMRCVTRLAVSETHETYWTTIALCALDCIRNSVNVQREVTEFTNAGHREMIPAMLRNQAE